MVAHDSAPLFITSRAVKPVPIATASRPGAMRATVATAEAVVITWRRFGTSTAVPSPMREVRSAINARWIQMSS